MKRNITARLPARLSSARTEAPLAALALTTLVLGGCPEQVRVVDLGAPDMMSGGVMEDQGAQGTGCFADDDCRGAQFCDLSGELGAGEGVCREGCRLEPDSCEAPASALRCDPESRACALSCEADSDCFDEQFCGERGFCEVGCRVDDPASCPPNERGPARCEPSTRACEVAVVCCDLEDACSVSDEAACLAVGGEPLPGLIACAPNPCGALCTRDGLCAAGEHCASYGRCAPGCRLDDPSACPADLSCDPESRRCAPLPCAEDAACPAWQYCGEGGSCLDGCREGGCGEGLRCDPTRACSALCASDSDCPEGYCDPRSQACRAPCDPATHQGCAAAEACVEGRCEVGCADDGFEVSGDDRAEGAPVVAWASGGVGEPRATARQPRVLCVGDEDWVRVPLAAGERLEVRVESRPSSGGLRVDLLSPSGALLASAGDPWGAARVFSFPAFGDAAGAQVAGDYLVRVWSDLALEPNPYTLQLSAAPAPLACFSDPADPSDDSVGGARALGLTPSLRFTERAEGSLCFGDLDHLCFPVSASDGLDLLVDAPPSCDPLVVRLSPSARVGAPFDAAQDYLAYLGVEGGAEGAAVSGVRGEGDWGAAGGARYAIRLDAESNAFTNDQWCAQLRADGPRGCEGYRLSASFSRRQAVCSDLREPNNVLPQATPLDGVGPLSNGAGEVPYGVDLPLSDPLFLCEGDLDVFAVRSRAGDAWRAWIVDDSDPADQPERGRGQLTGELSLRFLNADGAPVGDSAPINAPAAPNLQVATAVTSADADLYLQVRGVGTASGPYRLALRRVAPTGPCSQDVNEPAERDDELNPVSQLRAESPRRLSINNGLLCDPSTPPRPAGDEDWYTFEVAQNSTRLCVASAFRHRDGDVNLELFEAGDPLAGELCQTHADCRAREAGSSCIARRCRAPLSRSSSLNDGELVHISSAEGRAGRYYARLFSPTAAENAYQLAVTLVPPSASCEDDLREGAQGNDRPQDATQLGSGYAQVCDAWVCDVERVEGDWYEVVVPAGAQRTVHVAFETQQGRLSLSAEDASSVEGRVVDSPRSPSRNVHCLNIAAGQRPATVRLQVAGDTFNVNQRRVDYLLRVAPVDLNLNPRGACDALSGGLFTEVQWPTLDLRSP